MTLLLANTPGLGLVVPLLILMVTVGAVVVSVFGRWLLPMVPGWKVYLLSPVVSAALIYGYYTVRMLLADAANAPAAAAYRATYARLADCLTLTAWGIDLDPAHPTIRVEFTVRVDATVSTTVIAGSPPSIPGKYPHWHYLTQPDPKLTRRTLRAGETCRIDMPLQRHAPGNPEAFVITFEIQSPDDSVRVTRIYSTFAIDHHEERSLPLPPAKNMQGW